MASADEMADRMCLMRVLARRAPGGPSQGRARRAPGRGGAALMEIGTSQGAA
jgi:hypothetical protein